MISALTGLLSGYLEARAIGKIASAAENWAYNFYKLILSITLTILITFPGIWGLTTLSTFKLYGIWVSLGFGFATSLLITSAVVYNLCHNSEIAKDISIAIPTQLQESLLQQNVVTSTKE